MPISGVPFPTRGFSGYFERYGAAFSNLGPMATRISATWTCPTLSASGPWQSVVPWVGINSPGTGAGVHQFVIQAGTWHEISGTTPDAVHDYAWLSFPGNELPDEEVARDLAIDVAGGHEVTVSVVQESVNAVGLGVWRVEFTNHTTGISGTWHFPHAMSSENGVCMWIGAESPSFGGTNPYLPQPQFGTIAMSNCEYTRSGVVHPMNDLPLLRELMVNGAGVVQVNTTDIGGDQRSFQSVRVPTTASP
jgi:Peptidase A4 family